MSLKVAVQMDPLETIRIAGDTSFLMMLNAQARGHSLFVYTPEKMALEDGRLLARGRSVTVQDVEGDHAKFGPWKSETFRKWMWCSCVRTRPSTWPTSPPPTSWTPSTPGPWW